MSPRTRRWQLNAGHRNIIEIFVMEFLSNQAAVGLFKVFQPRQQDVTYRPTWPGQNVSCFGEKSLRAQKSEILGNRCFRDIDRQLRKYFQNGAVAFEGNPRLIRAELVRHSQITQIFARQTITSAIKPEKNKPEIRIFRRVGERTTDRRT